MGGKGRAAGPEPYVGMSPTQEFNARLSAASDFYTPKELRKTPDPAAPVQSIASDNQLGATDEAAPAGPGVGDGNIRVTKDTGGAAPTTAMPTGDMMAQSITAPTTKRGKTPADGSLDITGQV